MKNNWRSLVAGVALLTALAQACSTQFIAQPNDEVRVLDNVVADRDTARVRRLGIAPFEQSSLLDRQMPSTR